MASWNLTGVVCAGPFFLIYAVLSLVLKADQMSHSGDGTLFMVLRVWGPDLAWTSVLAAVFLWLFSRQRLVVRLLASVALFVVGSVLVALDIGSWHYYLKTGAPLSWSSVRYWLDNFQETNQILASEGGTATFILLGAAVAFSAAWHVALHLPVIRRKLNVWGHSGGKALALYGVLGATALGAWAIPAPAGPAMVLAYNIPVQILMDAVGKEWLQDAEVVVRQDERLDRTLRVVKDQKGQRYNVVVFLFESLSWKRSDVYVPGLGTTPFLAELAKESMVIRHQYTVLPHTTKAVLAALCGIYPYLGTEPKEASPGIVPRRCLAHLLGNQGYRSAFFQPAGNFEKREHLVANMGFDVYRGLDDLPQEGFEDTNYFGKEERMMLQPSLDWVDGNRGQPFLLTYLTLSTHHNYVTPQSFPYRDYGVEDKDLNNFLNAVRYTDEFFREVYQGFKERGLLENTVFIIVGDHGEAFGEHGRRQHDLIPWEEGMRSFGMLHAPFLVKGGGHVEGFRSHLDIVPTVVDLLGLQLEEGEFLGTSWLAPVPEDRRLHLSCWFDRRCAALREGPIKTIHHFGLLPPEVYDNRTDPYDEHNLAFTGEYDKAFIDARVADMERWVKATNQQYRDWEKALVDGAVHRQAPDPGRSVSVVWDDLVELVGIRVTPTLVRAGEGFEARYVFRVLKRIPRTVNLFVHLDHPGGFVNADHVPVRGALAPHQWEPGTWVVDEHRIHVPAGWKTGQARLSLGFWDKASGQRLAPRTTLPVRDRRTTLETVQVEGTSGTRVVSAKERRQRVKDWIFSTQPTFQVPAEAVFGGKVRLAGVDLDRMNVNLAGTVETSYVFQALSDIPASWTLSVELVGEDVRSSIVGDHDPINGLLPMRYWEAGEYVVDRHRIHIDMHRSQPGTYGLFLGIRAGRKPVPVTTSLPTDDRHRVRLGTVTIAGKE